MLDTIQNRAAVRARLQALREELGAIAAELDHVDHDAARALHQARDAMHDSWSTLRQAPLGQVIKAQVVLTVEGLTFVHDVDLDNLDAFMEVRGYPFTKLNDNRGQRAELIGQPKFQGVCGPMWNGDRIRYECPETYAQMSK
jgi:hypothetical protein